MQKLLHEKEVKKQKRIQRQIQNRTALLKRLYPEVSEEVCHREAEKEIRDRYRPVWEIDPPY